MTAVAYNLFVILFGAWVRISGSGAGCGEHWPMCNGEMVPRSPSVATMIEFTHRVTSGVSLVVTLALLGMVFARTPKRHLARKAAVANLLFILLEALVGAGLVLFGLVDKNSSVARAVVIALHLVNTLGLIASGTCIALWARHERPRVEWQRQWLLPLGAGAIALTSASGAITALGDTLFPVKATGETLAARLQRELTTPEHFLERLRVFHPLIAIATAAFLVWAYLRALDQNQEQRRWGKAGLALVTGQVLVGIGNIALAAPGWMQLVHLLLAGAVWLSWVGYSAARITRSDPP